MENDKLFGIHAFAARLRADRAGVLASNLANADTPDYKARDIDFSGLMEQVRGERLGLAKTATAHLPVAASGDTGELAYRVPLQPSLDGNTVDAHVEHAEFAENAFHYQSTLSFLDSRIKGLIKALRGE